MVVFYYGNQEFNGGDNVGYGEAHDFGETPPSGFLGALVDNADVIFALEGNDVVFGDFFNLALACAADTIYGGEGDDWLFGDTVDFDHEPLLQAFPFLVSHIEITLSDGTTLTITDDPDWRTRATAGGHDKLYGEQGSDFLFGGAGNDLLDGGTGADYMDGGAGNDRYYVDNLADVVDETAGNGVDTVYASVSFNISGPAAGQVEYIILTGSGATSATGNALSNMLDGSRANAANVLSGQGGNDTYVIGIGDTIVETAGTDTVKSSMRGLDLRSLGGGNVENAALTGTSSFNLVGSNNDAASNTLTGNAGANVINGLAGRDFISGGLGNDTLYGGVGPDYFAFTTALNATSNLDHIRDFNAADDTLRLENAIFARFATAGALKSTNFLQVGTRAQDADDYIVYNKSTGVLTYDANGSAAGTGIAFAVLDNKATLSSLDFVVI